MLVEGFRFVVVVVDLWLFVWQREIEQAAIAGNEPRRHLELCDHRADLWISKR